MLTNKTQMDTPGTKYETLASMDNEVIIDLLEHKTRLLIAATVTRLPDRDYINDLNSEVKKIQAEIKKRMT